MKRVSDQRVYVGVLVIYLRMKGFVLNKVAVRLVNTYEA